MKKVILTGDRPTGRLHVGHYVGSLSERVKLQNSGNYDEIYIMIADAQALTDNAEHPEKVRQNIIQVALDYLACGIDPEKSTIFIQSMVPELTELTFYYMNLVTVARVQRNPTVKSEIQMRNFEASIRKLKGAENTVQKHRRKNDNHHSGKKSVIIGVKGCCESRQKRRYCQLFPCDQHKRGPVILIPIIQKRKHSCCHNSRTCNWKNYFHPGLYIPTSINSRRLFQLSWDIVVIVFDHKKTHCNSTAGINQDQRRSCII